MEDLINLKDYSEIKRLKRKIQITDYLIYLTCGFFTIYLIWEWLK